ncbi:MAG: hypothetical protein AAFQ12_15830, partial [Pseudomonadota bacterium]
DAMEFEPIDENVNPSSLSASKGLERNFAYLQDLYSEDLGSLCDMIDVDISDWLSVPHVQL